MCPICDKLFETGNYITIHNRTGQIIYDSDSIAIARKRSAISAQPAYCIPQTHWSAYPSLSVRHSRFAAHRQYCSFISPQKTEVLLHRLHIEIVWAAVTHPILDILHRILPVTLRPLALLALPGDAVEYRLVPRLIPGPPAPARSRPHASFSPKRNRGTNKFAPRLSVKSKSLLRLFLV